MAVGIGQLDRRITISSYTAAKDEYGQDVKTFSTLISCWAKVAVMGGSEGQQDQQELSIRNVEFIVRYYSSINESCRITYDSKVYDIVNISEIGRRNYLKIMATLRTNQ